MDRNTMVQTQKQGISINKFPKERVIMVEDPTILTRALVTVNRSSLEIKDPITIATNIPREIRDRYPWKQEYLHPLTHLRRIIGPCPRPPQLFQTIPNTIALRTASDGLVEKEMKEVTMDGYWHCSKTQPSLMGMDQLTVESKIQPHTERKYRSQ
jgi:hypothetical protein